MSVRRYEFEPSGGLTRAEAFANVVADITALDRLGIDFTVTTERYEEFRHGGNVTKAKCISYLVQTSGQVQKVGGRA